MSPIFNLLLLAGLMSGAAPSNTPQPVLMFDANSNAFPSGSGTALTWSPQPVVCYTNASGSVIPCVFPASSAAADIVAFFNTINVNTVNSLAGAVITPVAAITITRVEWSFGSIGVTCTTTPIISVIIAGTPSGTTIPIATVNTKFQDFDNVSINVAANAVTQLKVTTAAAGCGTAPGNPTMIVHYKMQ